MTTHEASSSSSSKSNLWNYDVFLSFSGVDTRNGFTGHLHATLTDRGYQAYIDEDDLERGEEIKEELFRAIKEARISIIVFSKSYADSSWCLDELVKIMECRYKLGRRVLPIFYHVDPSHVRKQNGDLAQAFQKHEEGIREEKDDKEREAKQERVKQWRKALTEAANLSGQHLQITDNGREAKLIREIVGKIITEWLPSANELNVAKHPVGINSRVQDIISYLSGGGSNDVVMVGIWGMGGLGKTTAAKAIYNQIHHKFEFKSFLANVSEYDLVDLQGKLVSGILKQTESKISSVDQGISVIKNHLQRRSVLVIIDNVDKVEQLNAIAGNRDWFGPGSRIIITTRYEHLLKQVNMKVDKTYPLKKLNEDEALKLFSWHAFGNSWPNEGYLELSKEVVSYCGGLPLALEVLGSSMVERTPREWKSHLEKLKTFPNEGIMKPLRESFEMLHPTQKAIFLDISCFFIGHDKDYVAKILDGCNFFATIGISDLRERCLITVEDNKLNMHDLLREMAKSIISEKSPCHPGKWSRLWNREEVIKVLRDKSGTEEVEGLALGIPPPWPPRSNMPRFSTEAFANMKKLRLLKLYNVQVNGEYKHLPKELIWLCWERCPLKSIPDDFFDQPRLVILEITSSNLVQVWEGSKLLENLKVLNLGSCSDLKKSPDFSNLPNLEELILEGCRSLSKIHPSIGHLKKLSLVNLTRCKNLISLPGDFYRSKSVQTLVLDDCWQFSELPEDLGKMISLRVLKATTTAIRQLPRSTVRLKNLTHLSLACVQSEFPLQFPDSLHGLDSLRNLNLSNNGFLTLPSLSCFSKLENLWLNNCFRLYTIYDLPTNLKFLDASYCFRLVTMPNFSKMSNMRELNVSNSHALTEVPDLDKSLNSMTWIDMRDCPKLTADFRRNVLKGWTSCGYGGIFLNGNYVPDWFEFVNDCNKVSFDIPSSDGRNFEGLTLLCFYCSNLDQSSPYIRWKDGHPRASIDINNTKPTELRTCIGKEDWVIKMRDDVFEKWFLWQGQILNDKLNLQSGDKVDVTFEMPGRYYKSIKGTGVNLVWDKPKKENMHDFDGDGRFLIQRHNQGGDASSSSHV
ncbi:disease resistance protein RUN1-like [Malus sylvestris]|uniref:disease resistance protein RUN1-like n=1 Tax=Malus sylvestris TaxID=3752 RepID=UPI0021AD28C1|nr:disease resistance protein RUN1-like [Malus sylvestris]